MLDLVLDHKPLKKPDLTAVVIGFCAARLPKLVEAQAARVLKGAANAPMHLVTPEGRYLLVKPDEKPWLVGGEAWRLIGREVVDALRAAKGESATILVQGRGANVQALAEGVALADYRYNLCRSGKEAKRSRIAVHIPGHEDAVDAGIEVARAQNLARELADMPPNLLNPQTFAARARKEL